MRIRALRHFGVSDLRAVVTGTFASLPLQLDRLLLLALLGTNPSDETQLPLSVPYYALRPVAGLAQSWARVFYADLVRLDHSGSGILRERFERLLWRAAIVMAMLSCALVAGGSALLFDRAGLLTALWFLPLSLVRGWFAVQQLRAFVFASHARSIVVGVSVAVGLSVCTLLQLSDRLTLLFLTALLLVALFGFRGVTSQRPKLHLDRARRVSVAAWLARVSQERQAVRICAANVDASICQPASVTLALARGLSAGQVTRFGHTSVIWWQPVECALPVWSVAEVTGSALVNFRQVDGSSGQNALEMALESKTLPTELVRILGTKQEQDPVAQLMEVQKSALPGAMCITLTGQDPRLGQLGSRDLIRIRRAIMAGAREQKHIPRWAQFQAATYAPGGETKLAFVWVSGQGNPAALKRAVLHASWRASLGSSPV